MVEPCHSEWSHGRHYDLEGLEFLRQCFCYVYYDVDYLLDRSIAMIYFAFISVRRLNALLKGQGVSLTTTFQYSVNTTVLVLQ